MATMRCPRWRLTPICMAAAAGLWLLSTHAIPARPVSAAQGAQAVRGAEGDGKRQPKGARDKEEARRDLKSAGAKFKHGMKEMGRGIQKRFEEAKEDLKNPKRRPKKTAPAPEGG